jgi:histidinol-phosphatase (PHP family)
MPWLSRVFFFPLKKGWLPLFKADYHIHSYFSGDSMEKPDNIIQKARDLEFAEIAITDHLDPDYPDTDINFDLDLSAYMMALTDITKKTEDTGLKVRKGIETGLQKHIKNQLSPVLQDSFFDFVIGSIHCADGFDFAEGGFFEHHTRDEAHRIYFETLYENLKIFDGISVLGHLDFIKRYGSKTYGKDHKILDYSLHMDVIEEILKLAIHKGTGLEVNTSGFRYGLAHPHPHEKILSLYRELGGEIVTTGSDAHTADQIGESFNTVYAILAEMGFRYICGFDKKEPVFHRIVI